MRDYMKEVCTTALNKTCSTCIHVYYETEPVEKKREVRRQKCDSPDYNAPSYTEEQMMEDWGHGYCRFWAPRHRKDV